MTKKIFALPLVFVLALAVCSTTAFAEGAKKSGEGTSAEAKETSREVRNATPAKLKKDMEKLLAAAKGGKIAPRQQQFPQTAKSNLSKTTKIAILAAAVGSGIFLIVMFHALSKD